MKGKAVKERALDHGVVLVERGFGAAGEGHEILDSRGRFVFVKLRYDLAERGVKDRIKARLGGEGRRGRLLREANGRGDNTEQGGEKTHRIEFTARSTMAGMSWQK